MGLRRRGRFALFLLFVAVTTAKAQTSTWTGSGSTSLWTTANNWSGNTLPSSSSNVQFTGASSLSVNLNGNQMVNSLTLSGTNGYTLSNNTLTLGSGDITVSSPGSGSVTDTISSGVSFSTAAAVSVGANATLSLSGSVGGSSLTKSGAGTLIVAGTATFAGTTTVSAGTLQIGNGGTTGSLSGALALNTSSSTANFDLSSNTTYGQAITGNGVIDQEGSGSLTLSGTGISVTGSGIAEVTGSGALILNTGGSASVAELLAGSFAAPSTVCTLDLQGNGTTVTAADAYIGVAGESGLLNVTNNATLIVTSSLEVAQAGGTGTATVASGGILQLGNGSTGLSVAGNITDNSSVVFDNSNSVTYAGTLSGTGSLTQEGGGTLILTGTNTYSGGTTIGSGTLQIGSGGATSLATSGVTDNGSFVVDTSSSLTIAGNITGTGSLVQEGGGTTILTGTNTYSGGTTVSGGTLQLGNNGTTGTIAGNIVDNSTVAFDYSTVTDFNGNISGTGTVTEIGSSTTRLTGTNTFTGPLIFYSGNVAIGNGGTTGSITANILANGNLIFNRTTDYTYAGVISGSGSIYKVNTNTLTLTGSNAYTGITNLQGGTLNFSQLSNLGNGGEIAFSGGTLSWTGTNTTDISSRTVFIDTGGATFNTNGNSITLANAIGDNGTGSLTLSGGGAVTLAGTNTATGKTIVNIGTTLNIGNGGTSGSISGGIDTEGSTYFDRSDNITYAGALTGTNSNAYFGQKGSGTLTLTGSINDSGDLIAGGNGTLVIANGTTSTLGDIEVGSPILGSAGILTLSGSGTAINVTGFTAVGVQKAGTVNISSGATLDTANGFELGNGAAAVALNISGGGALTTEVLSGTGTVTLNNGTINFVGSNTLGCGTTLGSGGGTMTVTSGNTENIFDPIGGTGALTLSGGGTFVLEAADTATGSITVNATTFQIDQGENAGSISGNVVDNGNVAFGRSDSYTYSGNISGTGTLTQDGIGTLILTGTNTYTGGTTVAAGTLQINTLTALPGNIVDNAAANFHTGGTYAYTISGTGGVSVTGGGITLTGTNTFTGTTTVSSGSTLTIGNGGTTGSIANSIGIDAEGVVNFDRSDSVTFAGTVNGSSSAQEFAQTGTGTLTLTGSINYGGNFVAGGNGTLVIANGLTSSISNIYVGDADYGGPGTLTISGADTMVTNGSYTTVGHQEAGTLNISNGATLNAAGGLLLGENSGAATVNLNISGGGTLETASDVGGSGSITLNNGTILFSASAKLGSSTTLGSGGGSLLADSGTTITLSDGISGTGALTLFGGKFVILGADTATGGTTLFGTLQIDDGGTTGSISGNIDDNGSVVFDRSDSPTYSGAISGVGSLTQEGSGTLILTGTNTFLGTTTISAGTLQLGNGGTSGSVSGNINDNASLVFDRSDSPTYSGVISGSGSLTQKGPGTLVLTGANTYTGSTTVNNSETLSIGNGGTSGSISNSSGIDVEGTVDFDRADNITYSGAITGSNDLGILAQTGSGTLTLTGSINLNGSLIAAGDGTMVVNNETTSNVNDGIYVGDATYGSPGTLTLSGSNTVVNNPGFVVVGSQEAGTLNITNGATLNAESGLELGYGSGGAAATLNISGGGILSLGDSIDGNGTVTINNGTINYYGTSGLGCNVTINSGGATMTSASGSTYDLQNNISGTGPLTLSGSGTLVLTGTNTYTGGTNVSGGTVIVDNTAGSGTGTGAVDVKSGAIIGGGNGAEFSGTLASLGTG